MIDGLECARKPPVRGSLALSPLCYWARNPGVWTSGGMFYSEPLKREMGQMARKITCQTKLPVMALTSDSYCWRSSQSLVTAAAYTSEAPRPDWWVLVLEPWDTLCCANVASVGSYPISSDGPEALPSPLKIQTASCLQRPAAWSVSAGSKCSCALTLPEEHFSRFWFSQTLVIWIMCPSVTKLPYLLTLLFVLFSSNWPIF